MSHRLIVTIAVYNKDRFELNQNEFTFQSEESREAAAKHYLSPEFRKNIEAAGAFVKVDVYKIV